MELEPAEEWIDEAGLGNEEEASPAPAGVDEMMDSVKAEPLDEAIELEPNHEDASSDACSSRADEEHCRLPSHSPLPPPLPSPRQSRSPVPPQAGISCPPSRREPFPFSNSALPAFIASSKSSPRNEFFARAFPFSTSSPPSPQQPYEGVWLFINWIPDSTSEYHLAQMLTRAAIPVLDIRMEVMRRFPYRFAYVHLRSRRDQHEAIKLLTRSVPGAEQKAASFFNTRTRKYMPDPEHDPRPAYLGTDANARPPTRVEYREVLVAHLPNEMMKGDLWDFIEDSVGKRSIESIDFGRPIRELDGATFCSRAIGVFWSESSAACQPPSRPRRPPIQSAAATQPHSPPSRLPPTVATSVTTGFPSEPPNTAASSARPVDLDVARLRSIGVPDSTIDTLQQVWQPYSSADSSSKKQDLIHSNRSLQVDVEFGFLPRREAKMALDVNAEKPALEDPAKQKQYEAFLQAQAGESRDWYTIFFAKLAEFNRAAALFTEKGHEAALAFSASSSSL
ncbi:hypothetical protein JCM8547_002893 [Rhodosporidiobolus lusitaniae]